MDRLSEPRFRIVGPGRRWAVRWAAGLVAMLLGALVGVPAAAATGAIVNPSFEGNLSGWKVTVPPGGLAGAVTSFREYAPVDGEYFALLKTDGPGSYTVVAQDLHVEAGDRISGWSFFLTNDFAGYNDHAQVVIKSGDRVVRTLWYADVSMVGSRGHTGWVHWEYTFPAGGTYTLEQRVTNDLDSHLDSYSGLDGVTLTPRSCHDGLTWLSPLSATDPYAARPDQRLDIRFRWGTCAAGFIHDESVAVVVRTSAHADEPLVAWVYRYDIAIDDAAGEYRVSLVPADYGALAGETLTVEVYFGGVPAGSAQVLLRN